MESFEGKYAVVSGAGSGIGRALARALMLAGCHIAICDVQANKLQETRDLCLAENPLNVRLVAAECDVSDEAQIEAFREVFHREFGVPYINLLINNAGISGGHSFVLSSRAEWERTFDVCWRSSYLMTRVWLPALLESTEGHIVNLSSANAIRAVLGGQVPHTAYSAAKYAVQGFTESLIHDFRFNAPHLSVSAVLPGHTGTEILANSAKLLGQNQPEDWSGEDCERARVRWQIAGNEQALDLTDDETREAGRQEMVDLLALGMPAAEVATTILNGVKAKQWRILVGDDTEALDQLVREDPVRAYDPDFVYLWRERYQEIQSTKR